MTVRTSPIVGTVFAILIAACGGPASTAGGGGGGEQGGGASGAGGEQGAAGAPMEPDPGMPDVDAGAGGAAPVADAKPATTTDAGQPGTAKDAGMLPPPRAGAMPSTPCGMGKAKPDGAQIITVNAKSRRFIVRVPSPYDGKYPFPVIFAFHGANESGDEFDRGLWFRLDIGENAVLALPDAYDPTMKSVSSSWQRDIPDDIAFFDAMVAWLKANACFDTSRIFATGHSSGAYFSHTLGCQRGDVLRAIAPVAGGVQNATNCKGDVAVWIAQGDKDPMVTPSVGMQARDFWLQRNGCTAANPKPTDTPSCVAYAGCNAGDPVNWCLFDGMHFWPRFANKGLWAFFDKL